MMRQRDMGKRRQKTLSVKYKMRAKIREIRTEWNSRKHRQEAQKIQLEEDEVKATPIWTYIQI